VVDHKTVMINIEDKMRNLGSQILVSMLLVFVTLLLLLIAPKARAATIEGKQFEDVITSPGTLPLRQFTTSDRHIVGFGKGSVVVASLNHSLQMDLVEARAVTPLSKEPTAQTGKGAATQPFTQVTYAGLWDHVTAVFEAHSRSILKSTYYVDASCGENPSDQIRLHYNRPVRVDDHGNLVIAYENGIMTESAPVAWQDIGGQRTIVQVSYTLQSDNEVTFTVGDYDRSRQLVIDPTLTWSTFIGGASGTDWVNAMAVDTSGNIYVAGYSSATWGSPLRPFSGLNDAFVAKLNNSGTLLWNTFLGSTGDDWGNGIAVDDSGNVYVTGFSDGTWGTPKNGWSGGYDAFVAKLANSGTVTWNTFLGSSGYDEGDAIAVDTSGTVFVVGYSSATWGSNPVQHYNGGTDDAFAAKLTRNGVLSANTFLGGNKIDYGLAVSVDDSSNVYVAGQSASTWGTPRLPYGGGSFDAFVAKLSSSLAVTWNTFLGASGFDGANGITVNSAGKVYVAGESDANWGSPKRGYGGGTYDGFAARLSRNGTLDWNTFLGGTGWDQCNAIAVDISGNVYIAGYSDSTWGSPDRSHSLSFDAFAVGLDSSGALNWNTFLGGKGFDNGKGIAADRGGNVYVAGHSDSTWGFPIQPFGGGGYDGFITKLATALPIQLGTFSATIASVNAVTLTWTTVTETNNYGFYVERRAPGEQNFVGLPSSFVPGHGTTLQPQQYSYLDVSVTAGQWSYRLKQIDLDGTVHYTDPVQVEVLTDVKEKSLPTKFALEQNYPNPFNPTTIVSYQLPVPSGAEGPAVSEVKLVVYDLLGREVAVLVNERQAPGSYSVRFNASGLASGVYLYSLTAGSFTQTKTLMLLK
jgi:hypothetical protein